MIDNGFKVGILTGDCSPKKRTRSIDGFKSKTINFLVCNDIASRGLDFTFLNYVINYDFPLTISDYVHRAGRTGRCGREGNVITFYTKANQDMVTEMQESFNKNIPLVIKDSIFLENRLSQKKSNESNPSQIEKMKNILKKQR